MIQKKLTIEGHVVEVWDFGYAKFFYPSFNGNAEFKVSKQGFKSLRRYLKNINWMNKNLASLSI